MDIQVDELSCVMRIDRNRSITRVFFYVQKRYGKLSCQFKSENITCFADILVGAYQSDTVVLLR